MVAIYVLIYCYTFQKQTEKPSVVFLCSISPSPRHSPAFFSLHPLRRNLLHQESQLHGDGTSLPYRISYGHAGLYLPGWMAISLDHPFSFPYVMLVSWLRLKRQIAKLKVFVCCFTWEGLGNRRGSQYPVAQYGKESSLPPNQAFRDL